MDVQQEICAWLLKQQEWFQEAADRLINNGLLTSEDLSDLVALLKTPEGQKATNHRTFTSLMQSSLAVDELRLTRIDGVCGIENLGPRQPLDFGAGNLTVIYGHNGSGKSSYTRVLKKVSGKPRAVELKANVFLQPPQERKCQISYELNGKTSLIEWHVGSAPIEELKSIDIFDSDEANHYLSAESAATYIPAIVGLFEKLAAEIEKIRAMLDAEQAKLISSIPTLPPIYQQCEIASTYKALGKATQATLSAIINWTAEQEQQLKDLDERLKVQDPIALAKQKRTIKAEVQQLITKLTQTSREYGIDNLEAIRTLRKSAIDKRNIAIEGGKVQASVLDGIGTPTWRAMWEAAREFSVIPYPSSPFPVTVDARCILCQQELTTEAQQRLTDFEKFVNSKLEGDAKTAETLYQSTLTQLSPAITEQQVHTLCTAAGLSDEWKNYLWKIWHHTSQSRLALQDHERTQQAQPVENLIENLAELVTYRDNLETQAVQHELDAQRFDRINASKEKLGLEAKKWVAEQKNAIQSEVERIKKHKAYNTWKALAGSRSVSLKSAEITQKVVTEAYVARFNRELQCLGAPRIQIELVKTRTQNARVLHQLRLKGVQNDKPQNVLSEGERRIISLAAFLADVSDKPGAAPFVFDDPISSLDNDFEWYVACRLVELAKNRQVLVLTHRLSLYGALEDVAKKAGEAWKKAHYRPMCIEAYAGVAGHPAAQDVWNTNTKTANNILLTRLDAAKKAGETGGGALYRALAQGVCSDFRKLVERSVEEDLLNKVVLRHRRSVTTDGRLSGVRQISSEDCKLIDDLMTKYSCYEHSQSAEVPVIIPEEPELRADIESLRTWRDNLKAKRDKIIAV
ncbi:AAA family ATPase [Erwinia oleae]|uniref:AAA family ATPase n=1 Tax=Erwinia oleae TaxID=796334 RepID=UPI0005591D69|nr:AAA family ATPase [Erwinia oleae]